MNTLKGKTIAVIGGHEASEEQLAQAEAVGALVAKAGGTILTGGLVGIMEAASKGAFNAKGHTLGILPGLDKDAANPYVQTKVATGFGAGRNIIIARTADAFVAVGGAYGTLSEIAHALQLNKPVAGIDTWEIKGVMRAKNATEAIELISERLA
jgi:uncharacterized protein (TIGR00725 family)